MIGILLVVLIIAIFILFNKSRQKYDSNGHINGLAESFDHHSSRLPHGVYPTDEMTNHYLYHLDATGGGESSLDDRYHHRPGFYTSGHTTRVRPGIKWNKYDRDVWVNSPTNGYYYMNQWPEKEKPYTTMQYEDRWHDKI